MEIAMLSASKSIPEIVKRKELAHSRSLEIYDTIRRDIRSALSCLRWSDAELSRQSGISPATISRLLGGQSDSSEFHTVMTLYETLGIPLPFGKQGPRAPVSLYVGAEDADIQCFEVPENRQHYISILPELRGKKVAQVKDDSAQPIYPEGAYVFISPMDTATLLDLRAPKHVLVKSYKRSKVSQIRIMTASIDRAAEVVRLDSIARNSAPLMLDLHSLKAKAANSGAKIELAGIIEAAFC